MALSFEFPHHHSVFSLAKLFLFFNYISSFIFLLSLSSFTGGYSSASHFFQHAPSHTLQKYTRLDQPTFSKLHTLFLPYWQQSMKRDPKSQGHLTQRKLSSECALGLVLRWLASGARFSDLVLIWGVSCGTVSKYLGFGLKCLYKALRDCPSAQLSVSYEQL